jgi:NurA-like 5'-3' nuclease
MSLDTLQAELDFHQQILDSVKTTHVLDTKGLDLKNKLIENLSTESDTSTKIRDIQSTINNLLKEQVKSGSDINNDYINHLKASKKLFTKELQITEAKKDFTKSLKESIGLNNKYVEAFKKGGAAALGWIAMNKAVEVISKGLDNTVGLGKDLYINFGLSAGRIC